MRRNGLTRMTITFLLLASLATVTTTPSSAANDKAGNVSRGAREWAENCGRCHNLRGPKEYPDGLWRPVIAHMRVQAGLTGQQARDILAFIQATNNRTTEEPVSKEPRISRFSGEQIYSQTCLPCHGADGRGALPGVPDLRARLGAADEILLDHITHGFQTPGSPMAMPAKGGNPDLTQDDLVKVLSYMREHFQK